MVGPYSDRAVSKLFWVAGAEEQNIEIHVDFQAFDPGARIHVSVQTDAGDMVTDFGLTEATPDAAFYTTLKPSAPAFQLLPPAREEPATATEAIPVRADHGNPSDREPELRRGYRIVFSLQPGPGRLPMAIHGLYTLRGGPAVTLSPPWSQSTGPIPVSITPGRGLSGVWQRLTDPGRAKQRPRTLPRKRKTRTESTDVPGSHEWQQEHLEASRMNFENLQQLHRLAIDSFTQAQQASELLQMRSAETTRHFQEAATRLTGPGSLVPRAPAFDPSTFERMAEQTERMNREARDAGDHAAEAQRQLEQARWTVPDSAAQVTNWGQREWLTWNHP
jgi:hypothetical protein